VYHLYFGNEFGSPGTIITFFPSAGSPKGKVGGGQVGITTYIVPEGSLSFWESRLDNFGISITKVNRFNEDYLQLTDNEGLRLELVERREGKNSTWSFGGIPPEKAIKGFGGAVLFSVNAESTMETLQNVLGLKKVGENAELARFQATGEIGNIIDVPLVSMDWGIGGSGTVHHIAWRANDFSDHDDWQKEVMRTGFHSTQIIDRQYFNAIYFRENGGILFEIATDPPGFANDEPAETLGEKLMLPEWYEKHRTQIQANLLPIKVRELVEKPK
jgi:glyoxalase family protein